MRKTFRFRTYPSRKQISRIATMLEVARGIWNQALAERRKLWKDGRKPTSFREQCKVLAREKKSNLTLSTLYAQSAQDVLMRLDHAFRAYVAGNARFPRTKREVSSITYPQAYKGCVKLDPVRKRLFLSKIGNLRVVAHRSVPPNLKLKTCTFKRETDGKWYACLVYDDDVVPLQEVKIPGSWNSPIGVDRGLVSLVVTSDGEKVQAPRFMRKAEKKLNDLQRVLSRKQKGSKNRTKARRKLSAAHSKVANQRRDFNQKLSARLVRKHDLIGFEDLDTAHMLKNQHMAKSISDAGWRQLAEFVEYKASMSKDVGEQKFFVKVPTWYSTQECWFCGTLNLLSLEIRAYECKGCHRILDRDRNAGRIVLKRAIAQVGQDRTLSWSRHGGENPSRTVSNLKPAETEPLPLHKETASSVVETGTKNGAAESPPPASERPRVYSWEDVTGKSLEFESHLRPFRPQPSGRRFASSSSASAKYGRLL